MIRLIGFFAAVLITYFIYGFYVSQQDLTVVPAQFPQTASNEYHDYRGVLNVHTSLGRGSASPQAVINVARNSDLDFMIITDVNQFSGQDHYDGYYGPLMVLQEPEFSYLDSRVTIFPPSEYEGPSNHGEASVLIADLLSQTSPRNRAQHVGFLHNAESEYGWTGDLPTGLDAIEILNSRAIAYRAWKQSKLNVVITLLIYPFNPLYSFLRLYHEPADELRQWDEAGAKRPLYGFAGAEASARAIPLADYLIRFPSYRSSFSISSNHVLMTSELTGNYKMDRQKLLTAFKKGQYYFAIDLLGDPRGFFTEMHTAGARFTMGSSLRWHKDLTLHAEIPIEPNAFFEIVLLRNGERIATSNTRLLDSPIPGPGVYRIIVRVSPQLPLPDGKKWITWIFSNPFFVNP